MLSIFVQNITQKKKKYRKELIAIFLFLIVMVGFSLINNQNIKKTTDIIELPQMQKYIEDNPQKIIGQSIEEIKKAGSNPYYPTNKRG